MSTFTTNKNFEQPAHNSFVDSWDVPVNADWSAIDNAFGGVANKNSTGLSGNVNLVVADYQPLTINVTGLPTAAITYVVPSGVGGAWVFVNATTGGFNVGIKSAAGGSTVVIPAASNAIVTCDGSATGMRLAVNVPPSAGGSNTQVQYNSGGLLAGSANLTFNGTTLTAGGLNVQGNTSLGSGSGSALTLVGATIAITPNTLTIGTGNLLVLANAAGRVGIGTATLSGGNLLTVAGNIKITTGGLVFSDGTSLLSAAALAPGGTSGNVQFNNGSGGFGGDGAHFTYSNSTHTLSVDNLTLGNPLPVASGGTGVGTSTGTVNVVLSNSPTLTGTPLAPTNVSPTDATTQIATDGFVQNAIAANVALIASASPSGVANYALTGLGTTYNSLEIRFELLPVTNNVSLNFTLYNSAGTEITTTVYGFSAILTNSSGGNGNAGSGGVLTAQGTVANMSATISNDATSGGVSGVMTIVGMQSARHKKTVSRSGCAPTSGLENLEESTSTTIETTSTISGFKLFFSSGNIASGTVRVIGIK